MWFVLDNALVLPEYLVEFEYITNLPTSKTAAEKKEDALNEDCNKLLAAVNNA